MTHYSELVLLLSVAGSALSKVSLLPSFKQLKENYPGYKYFGGKFSHRHLLDFLVVNRSVLLRDSSALRLSLTLNQIGDPHSLGRTPIKLSTHGVDSVSGREGLQYIFHPLAYGPYLVDKYGYPNVSLVHQTDPVTTKDKFWGKQGIVQVSTFTRKGNKPKGHVGLWDCDHFHQAKDWIGTRTLVTVEMWASPDSDCSHMLQRRPAPHGFRILPPHPLKAAPKRKPEVANNLPSSNARRNKTSNSVLQHDTNVIINNGEDVTKTVVIPNKPSVKRVKGIKFDPILSNKKWQIIQRRNKKLASKRFKHFNDTSKWRKWGHMFKKFRRNKKAKLQY